jgi:hypothetical protein
MRSKTSHAAKSGVGEHTARESESAQRCATGKSAWRAPTPNFGPGAARLRGQMLFGQGTSIDPVNRGSRDEALTAIP